MKYVIILCLLLVPIVAAAEEASLAWFTDADIANSARSAKPANALPAVPGCIGQGVNLTQSVGFEAPVLNQKHGMISFWIKPEWNGNDGKAHKLLKIGDPTQNGILIEKTSHGTLRFLMASPTKSTASRTDVSDWTAGKWHQVAVSWVDQKDKPLGLGLWVDKTCVTSTVYGGDEFMNPDKLADKKVYVGDATSNAVMDELIVRDNIKGTLSDGQLALIYRDYFRTAPYTAIKIDNMPNYIKADKRVVNGCEKQFGLMAEMEGKWVRITDFANRYCNWGEFDAKPYIAWTTSDPKIATVDNTKTNGRVTGTGLGHCALTAKFRGMSATYDLEVISPDQPDLDVLYVERLPRYSRKEDQKWPAVGGIVESVVHLANFGFADVPAGSEVRFELIPDTNRNFAVDLTEKPTDVQTYALKTALKPGQTTTISFNWKWPSNQTFVRVIADPDNKLSEICKANNERCELNNAKAFHWGYNAKVFKDDYTQKHINLVGSFSDYDWCNSEADRMTVVMRDAVFPSTSPYGVKDSIRVDQYTERVYGKWEDEPWEKENDLYDGGFPDMEPQNNPIMCIDAAVGHEIGHTTIGLPDMYGFPYRTYNVFLKDENGNPYGGTQIFPEIRAEGDPGMAPYTSAFYDHPDNLGFGYGSLMVDCHLWLDEHCASLANTHLHERKGIPDMDPGIDIPQENKLQVFDINDEPLKGAAIYVYQVICDTNISDANPKYVPDRTKFIGKTDENGYYTFSKYCDPTWDDPSTDEIDGEINQWNPWMHANGPAWSSSWTNGECLVLKIVSGDKTEFSWLPLTEANNAYLRGQKDSATYPIRTSLVSAPGGTKIVRPVIADAIRRVNQKPIVLVPSVIEVKPGEKFTIDGSKSYDPEGQPLIYRWLSPKFSTEPIMTDTAPMKPGDYDYQFYVLDGLRISNCVTIKVRVK